MNGDCTDAAIDAIYDEVDELLRRDLFEEVDHMLLLVQPTKMTIVQTLAYISIAYVARERLPSWRPLVTRARAHFEAIAPDRVDALLQGWEGET